MNLGEILKPLEDLYNHTSMDWNCDIHLSLTEPACPTICIRPECTNIMRYTTWCDTDKVEESLKALVARVYAEIVEGKVETFATGPMTNSDDSILWKWFVAREYNNKEEFPYITFYNNYHENQKKLHPARYETGGELIFGNDENKDQNNA